MEEDIIVSLAIVFKSISTGLQSNGLDQVTCCYQACQIVLLILNILICRMRQLYQITPKSPSGWDDFILISYHISLAYLCCLIRWHAQQAQSSCVMSLQCKM